MKRHTVAITSHAMREPTRPLIPQDFRLKHRLRVRWGEVDIQRIVFNPHYLMYIDGAFTEYWRALGIPYASIPALLQGDLYVKKSTLEYHGSARLDDMLDICLKCERIGNSSLLFRSGIFRCDTLLVSAEMVYVFADPASQRPKPVPQTLRALLPSYEAGESPLQLRLGSWADLGKQASVLRQAVFVDELQIDAGFAQDALDPPAVHALVSNRLGEAVATGRLTQEVPGVARIARVAVASALRATGFGRMLVHALIQHASDRGDTRVNLCAQSSAQGFYSRLGFHVISETFKESNLPQVEMVRALEAHRSLLKTG
jgi:YbgC/YbaW family acyl-CoA thioester hydrolase